MALISLYGVNYNELPMPSDGSTAYWKLASWGQHVLSNGVGSPGYYSPAHGWVIRVAPFGIVPVFPTFISQICKWLASFSPQDCPVNTGEEISVENVSFVYTFNKVTKSSSVYPLMATPAQSSSISSPYQKFLNSRGSHRRRPELGKYRSGPIVTHAVCDCGAAKTYHAGPGSSLHSAWCSAK